MTLELILDSYRILEAIDPPTLLLLIATYQSNTYARSRFLKMNWFVVTNFKFERIRKLKQGYLGNFTLKLDYILFLGWIFHIITKY